ncbi:hypothetical protein DPMN_081292 [Dreissena polymorpha]|uniref:Uncharacterized protein n=1 Tax=Dreissena polymorpha TaxID=45954 RepID=A0A9D3Y4T3_DREPO|nr:hypothetical protein DPMN_081292 [Dreissena polymorpha]
MQKHFFHTRNQSFYGFIVSLLQSTECHHHHQRNRSTKSTSVLKASDHKTHIVRASTSTGICNSSSNESEEDDPSELCCVCSQRRPPAGQNMYVLSINKWAQCDGKRRGMPCMHWVHIPHCSDIKVVRRHSEFHCPCCASPAHHEE